MYMWRRNEEATKRNYKEDLVEYVKTPLSRVPHHHPRFFQKEVGDLSTIWLPTWTELDFKVFSLQES